MKKAMIVVLALMLCASVAFAQTYANPAGGVTGGITGIDKLGAHQNGGRGCVGCHAPHSGGRGNGGVLVWDGAAFVAATDGGEDQGDLALWGQELGPVYGQVFNFPTGDVTITDASPVRMIDGVAMCLSCHDGNVAKGAMMTNVAFEQTAGLLPAGYGTRDIPTLLGNDGGTAGNYHNDHPVGPLANLGTLSGIRASTNLLALDAAVTKIVPGTAFAGSNLERFRNSYGLPTITGARTGAGFVVETGMTSVDQAYVVCTTCHTPHSMYTHSASASNPIATLNTGTFPSYFFVAAPYNPGANTANGTKASSATQFCRQCHFTGAGGSNEGSNIQGILTAF